MSTLLVSALDAVFTSLPVLALPVGALAVSELAPVFDEGELEGSLDTLAVEVDAPDEPAALEELVAPEVPVAPTDVVAPAVDEAGPDAPVPDDAVPDGEMAAAEVVAPPVVPTSVIAPLVVVDVFVSVVEPAFVLDSCWPWLQLTHSATKAIVVRFRMLNVSPAQYSVITLCLDASYAVTLLASCCTEASLLCDPHERDQYSFVAFRYT